MCTLHMYRVRITKAFIKKFHLFHNMPHYNIYNYYYYYCYYVLLLLLRYYYYLLHAVVYLPHTSIIAEKSLLISFCSSHNGNWVTKRSTKYSRSAFSLCASLHYYTHSLWILLKISFIFVHSRLA